MGKTFFLMLKWQIVCYIFLNHTHTKHLYQVKGKQNKQTNKNFKMWWWGQKRRRTDTTIKFCPPMWNEDTA